MLGQLKMNDAIEFLEKINIHLNSINMRKDLNGRARQHFVFSSEELYRVEEHIDYVKSLEKKVKQYENTRTVLSEKI